MKRLNALLLVACGLAGCGGGDEPAPISQQQAVDGTTYPIDSQTDKAPLPFTTATSAPVTVTAEVIFKIEASPNGGRVLHGTLAVMVDGVAYAETAVTVGAANTVEAQLLTRSVAYKLPLPAGPHVAATRFRMTASAGVTNADAIHFVRTTVAQH